MQSLLNWVSVNNPVYAEKSVRKDGLFLCGFSPWSAIEILFKEMRECFTQNHPICGYALLVIQKKVIPIYNSKCSSHYCKERNDVLMANKTNELSHSKWVCKYHIVFTPKYRRKIIYNQYREDLIEIFKRLCSYKGVKISKSYDALLESII